MIKIRTIFLSGRILMLEQEVVSERDLRGKSDRVRLDVHRDLEDTLEQLRMANLNNDSKDKDLKVNLTKRFDETKMFC